MFHSLRAKLILVSVLVEIIMLGLLVSNGVRLIDQGLLDQAKLKNEDLKPLFNAALVGPMAQRDYATLNEILHEIVSAQGVTYLILLDKQGKVAASAGWDVSRPLPALDRDLDSVDAVSGPVFDTQTPIAFANQKYGELRYGLSLKHLWASKQNLVRQSILIAGVAVVLTLLILMVVGMWLTRHLSLLTQASQRIANGDFDFQLDVKRQDEIGVLTLAMNQMSQAIQSRVQELTQSKAKFHAIADYTYDWENWVDPQGKLLWVNSSVERLTGYSVAECLAMEDFPKPLFLAEDRDRASRDFINASRGGTREGVEFRIVRKDGAVFWSSIAYQPIYDVDGRFLGHRSSVRDT